MEKEKALELLRDFSTGMLITHDAGGSFHGRPMMIAEVDEGGTISFITAREGEKVDEVVNNPEVGITLQGRASFVAVRGRAQVVSNVEEKRRVWSKMNELWFDSPDDPRAVLIQVSPKSIEYWDQRGLNALRFAFSAVQAAARGEAPQVTPRQHGDAKFS